MKVFRYITLAREKDPRVENGFWLLGEKLDYIKNIKRQQKDVLIVKPALSL